MRDATILGAKAAGTAWWAALTADATGADPAAPVRWVSQPILTFEWGGGWAYLSVTDLCALTASAFLVIRFAAWSIAPLVRPRSRPRAPRRLDPPRKED